MIYEIEVIIMTNKEHATEITLLPFSLDIEFGNYEDVIVLAEKGVSLPLSIKHSFDTSFRKQTSLEFQIIKRYDSMSESLGWIVLNNLHTGHENSRINVTFEIDGKSIEKNNLVEIVNLSAKDENNQDIKFVIMHKTLDYYEELRSKKSYYEILSVTEDADYGDIEDAGSYKSGLYPDYSKEYEIINEARNALIPEKRDLFDKERYVEKEVDEYSRDVFKSIMGDNEVKNLSTKEIKEKGYIRNKILEVVGQKHEQKLNKSNPIGFPPYPDNFNVKSNIIPPYPGKHIVRFPPFPGKEVDGKR